ncbi:MAG: endonuclease/exonuclease/phosphatase family protein [Bryobacteraceae bacterium]|nr:endonuclease/exonuclease/phosphatase family protein [Bryobacteraceae bacterium]
MRSRRTIFLLPVLFMLPLQAEELRVMSFNVRYPAKGDGPNQWEYRRDLLVETVRQKNPDVLGTQELYYEQGQYIVEKLPEYTWFGLSRRGNHEDEHMGVFYRKDKLKLLDSGNFWLSETPEKPGSDAWGMSLPRMVTWGLFEIVSSKRKFYFYNTHFPHRSIDEPARVKCAELIHSRLAKLPAGVPVVITGDFNTNAGNEPYRILTNGYKDAWESAGKRFGPTGTFHGFKGQPSASRIDWILWKGPWKALVAETVADGKDGRWPSDHFPVFAVFQLP